jgi:hypothetical protein
VARAALTAVAVVQAVIPYQVILVELVALALCELFTPAQLASSHQQIQGICNGTLYPH